jgi:hypothetical protein
MTPVRARGARSALDAQARKFWKSSDVDSNHPANGEPMRSAFTVVAILATLFASCSTENQESEAHERQEASEASKAAPALAAAMKEATVSLASGLEVCEKEAQPISAKFEIEDGKLQLSVYTMKGDKYFEVIVDHKTGKVAKTEPITEGEDLADAKKQAAAMAKGHRSLRDVVREVEGANAGYQAVRVEPDLEGGSADVDVDLLKGTESKHVEKKL